MTPTIREQILAVRDAGLTNMFDLTAVQRIAYSMDFFELVCFLDEHQREYARFILTSEE